MEKSANYNKTIYSCFVGYIVQAITVNFAPLLFYTFEKSYGIPLGKITLLITFNFVIQFLTDLLSPRVIDRIGYRASVIIAHIFSSLGLIALAVLPALLGNRFFGLLIATVMYAVGGGLIEVLVSPIMEGCPTDNKEKAMSLLHSFYCWGQVGVVLVSTIFFKVFGIERWQIIACAWAIIPLLNVFSFAKAPIAPLIEDGEKGLSYKELFSKGIFWLLMLMMMSAGASELSVSQWASTFAEQGLGVTKAVGDLAGPMAFAMFMGLSRLFYGKYGDKINLDIFMIISGALCFLSYLIVSLSPGSILSLVGCGMCGLSVGIMWPGTFSKAAASIRNGGTIMFALLALAGDLGCLSGPSIVGFASSMLGNNLKLGILCSAGFPILLVIGIIVLNKRKVK